MQTCERLHAHYIIPSRIKEKCHVDFPIWKRQPGRKREKRPGQKPGYLGLHSNLPQLWKMAPVLWTSLSCPHYKVARISSHSVFTTLDGPKARMMLASSSKTRCSPLGGFHFPRISLSTCSGRLLEHQPLSTFPALSQSQPQARDVIFQAEASPHPCSL